MRPPVFALRQLLLALLFACVVAAMVVWAAPNLIKKALNQGLPYWLGSDSQPVQLEISHLSWRELKLTKLVIPLDDGGILKIKEARASYSLGALLQGRIHLLHIDELTLELSDQALLEVATEVKEDAQQIAASHFNEYLQIPEFKHWLNLPIDELDIARIEIDYPQAQASLQARVSKGFWRLHGLLTPASQLQPWRLELQLQDSGRWFLLLSEDSQTLLQQFGYVQQTPEHTRIELQQKLYFVPLKAYFDVPFPLEKLELQGTLTLPNKGFFPAESQLQMQAQLSTSNGQVLDNQWQANEWQLQVTKSAASEPWQINLSSSPVKLHLAAQYWQPISSQALQLNSKQDLTGQCSMALDECTLQGQLVLHLNNAQQALSEITLQPVMRWHHQQGLQLDTEISAQSLALLAQNLELPLTHAQLTGQLGITLDRQHNWRLTSAAGLAAQLHVAEQQGWRLSALDVVLMPNLDLYGNLALADISQQLRSNPIDIHIRPFMLEQSAQSLTLNLAASQLSCRPFVSTNSSTLSCQLATSLQPSHYQHWPLPDVQLSGSFLWRMQPQQHIISTQLALQAAQQQMQIRLNAHHDVHQGQGNLQWHLADTQLNWQQLGLTEMGQLSELELLDGRLSGQGWLDWQQQADGWQLRPDTSVRIDNLTATYGQLFTLENWSALISLRRPFMQDYVLDAQLSGERLNPGVPLTNILARSQVRISPEFDFAVADIYEVRTHLLGGTLHTPRIHFDTRRTHNALTIELERLQLAQITALEPTSEVQATGTLDGIVPIVFAPQGAQIPIANLQARAPGGTVSYHSATAQALAASDQGMGLAMQLLQDFRYDRLHTQVQYQPDGQFNLGLQFQGYNPQFFQGQTANLNVNLDYNLLDLLESLRLTDDVVGRLEADYR